MNALPLWSMILAMLAVCLWPWPGDGVARRVRWEGARRNQGARRNHGAGPNQGAGNIDCNSTGDNAGSIAGEKNDAVRRIGVAQMLTAMIARMNSGGTLLEACEEQYGRRFATREITIRRLAVAFERRRMPDETRMQAARAARGAYAAAKVSERLGCRASPCLEVVLAGYRQMRLLQNLQSQALAVPKATVGMLSALPMVTMLLGELMGARPMEFLLGSAQGLACLLVGCCCYAIGLLWVRALLRGGAE